MNITRRCSGWMAAAYLVAGGTAQAQFTGSYQTNNINGVTNNAYVSYLIGSSARGDGLIVTNLGLLTSQTGYLGVNSNDSNNWALVTGSGSVWNNSSDLNVGYRSAGNKLSVASGGMVNNAAGYIGNNVGALNNNVTVTGGGSVWSNKNNLFVGYTGALNSMTVSNGGAVYNDSGYIGYKLNQVIVSGFEGSSGLLPPAGNGPGYQINGASGGVLALGFGNIGVQNYSAGANYNAVTITGTGSVWASRSNLYLGYGGNANTLTITNGGTVAVGGSLTISAMNGSADNALTITGGQLLVSNGAINVGASSSSGSFNLHGGTVYAGGLAVNQNAANGISFTAGTLDVAQAVVGNGSPLVVGDGEHAAGLNLRGGESSFDNNLVVSSNGFFTGTGVIASGDVTIQQGGQIAPGSSRALGTLTFYNALTLSGTAAIKLANDAGTNGASDFLDVGGQLDLSGGIFDFAHQDTLTNSIYIVSSYGSLVGELSTTNNLPGGYILDTNYQGHEVALVMIPEPVSMCLLVLFGGGCVIWRRMRRWKSWHT